MTGMTGNASPLRARVTVVCVGTAASLLFAVFVASPAVPNTSAPGSQSDIPGVTQPDDDVGPSVAIEGRRVVRAPDAARIRVIGADNKQIRSVEVLYSHARILHRSPPGVHAKRMDLSLTFRRAGRYRLRASATDATGVTSSYKRATVTVKSR